MYCALIVLYNKFLKDSKTYDSLKKYKDKINIVIFDNSSSEYVQKNIKQSKIEDIQYYTLNENVGLSKAYNYVINKLKKKKNVKYLMIFDDDTELNCQYISESIKVMNNNMYDIILPIIKAKNHILSPTKLLFNIKYIESKNPTTINPKKIDAINTGMIIKMSVYDNIKYDERLFLDDVDHLFIYYAKKNNCSFYIMDTVIYQNYSRFQKNDEKSEKFRFKIWMKDHKEYCKIRKIMFFYYATSVKHRIREFVKYKFDFYYLFYRNN